MNIAHPITIRAVRPDDVERLRVLLQELSFETRYQRFHEVVVDFTAEKWRYLTCVDGHDHVALVACRDQKIVGVCRYIRDRHRSDVAEVAFVVSDDVQGQGVGRRLCDELVHIARAKGIRSFQAFVTPENVRIRRLLSGGGLALVVAECEMLEASLVSCESAAE
jgi:RimJ/RimL family protein N-acetyltransferase